MDEPTAIPTGRRSRRKRRRLLLQRILIGLAALAVLALMGWGGLLAFKVWRVQHTVHRARTLLDKKNYADAALSLRWALQRNPRDIEATRMMAEIAAANGERAEIYWRRKVAELQPGVLENWIASANAALRFKEVPAAQEALAHVDEAGKQTSTFHEAAARLAAELRESALARSNVAEAARMDPKNERFQLELATLNLGSPNLETRKEARAVVELHAANPKLRRGALRALIQEALFSRDARRALSFAEQLNFSREATFEDRMLYLSMLKESSRREFWWCLAQLQGEIAEDAGRTASLLTWMNKARMAPIALAWSKRLSEEVRTRSPVPIAIAESCLMLGDWAGVKGQVTFGDWKDLEFERQALYARVLRDQGDTGAATNRWNAAVNAARALGDQNDSPGSRAEALFTLARLAKSWDWEEEMDGVLWLIARGNIRQQQALDFLNRLYVSKGKTRDLLSVATRELELKPEDATAKNNVAYLSLLLNVDLERAHALAKDVYKTDPLRPVFVTTYAMSLRLQGKTEQGLKVMRALPENDLETPGNALFYGVLLADSGAREPARKYLELAARARLFPQEQALIAKAREELPPR